MEGQLLAQARACYEMHSCPIPAFAIGGVLSDMRDQPQWYTEASEPRLLESYILASIQIELLQSQEAFSQVKYIDNMRVPMESDSVAQHPKPFRIGIDVGGTNTDAAIVDTSILERSRCVVAAYKAPTSSDITTGIETAVRAVLDDSKICSDRISSITIGTTHFINALIERDTRHIARVAVLRLSRSFTREVPPFSDFPQGLRSIIECYNAYVDGGLNIDGSEEAQVREDQVSEFCAEIQRRQIRAVAVVGVFSPLDTVVQQEHIVQAWIERKCPGVIVVPSASISNIGLLERENATILNAAIVGFARQTISQFRRAIKDIGLSCSMYLTQNDGTLLDAQAAARAPIKTFSSGPTNSMRGAAYLSGIGQETARQSPVLVCDIGGTTSDIGMLLPSGYPRQTLLGSTVSGVRVNYAMPQVESIGIGGGSLVHCQNGRVRVGDKSVGRRIRQEAMIFGGTTLTATDIAVFGEESAMELGNPCLLYNIDEERVSRGRAFIKDSLERVVDMMKTSPGDLDLILVGGGSIIAPKELKGISNIIQPHYFDVANAIGAATAKLSATVDMIHPTANQTTQHAIEDTKSTALKRLFASGATQGTETVTEIDVLPLQYVDNKIRICMKVVGDHDSNRPISSSDDQIVLDGSECHTNCEGQPEAPIDFLIQPPARVDEYRPKVVRNPESKVLEWYVSEIDLDWMADGCYVLGCGGGGDPRPEMLKLKRQLHEGHRLRCIDPSSLRNESRVYWGGNMGSPSVPAERLCANEAIEAMEEIMSYHGHTTMDAIIGLEIGGSNGLLPLSHGSTKFFDVPVVDADWMGRAFPNLWQVSIVVHQRAPMLPVAIASGDGRRLLLTRSPNDKIVDETLRAPAIAMGYYVGLAASPCSGEAVAACAIKNTLSQAWRIGRCIARADQNNQMSSVCEQIIEEIGGDNVAKVLFRGKIVGIERKLHKGHSHGEVVIEHVDDDTPGMLNGCHTRALAQGGHLHIPFMNENLMARHMPPSETPQLQRIVASVPDLIAVLNAGSGKALGIGDYRYGVHVVVLGITCAPVWGQTEAGVRDGGPSAFGYDDVKYVPLGVYRPPRSVITEFGEP